MSVSPAARIERVRSAARRAAGTLRVLQGGGLSGELLDVMAEAGDAARRDEPIARPKRVRPQGAPGG
jgi:hypothetical protein